MKTAVSLPDPLFEAADRMAERLGLSRSELYANALESYLRSHQGEEITAALNHVYAEEDSSLDERWGALQAGSLSRDAW
jgi:metal-responsive CopG/Arc/MetJ family transcriptional regulator